VDCRCSSMAAGGGGSGLGVVGGEDERFQKLQPNMPITPASGNTKRTVATRSAVMASTPRL